MLKGQLSKVPCQATLGCRSISSLLFRCFSSPTKIDTHSSKLFTQN